MRDLHLSFLNLHHTCNLEDVKIIGKAYFLNMMIELIIIDKIKAFIKEEVSYDMVIEMEEHYIHEVV